MSTLIQVLHGARRLARRELHIFELFDLDSDDAAWPPPGSTSAPSTARTGQAKNQRQDLP
jgi:hypothetical protein